ncbi:MAG: hypothetical protein JRN15_10675 [Nitrososphaerota archaeon]|nr:hypothetical protein [Nitrososphaerota archaeon]
MQARQLNNSGISEFRNYIELLHQDPSSQKPYLETDRFSSQFDQPLEIEEMMKFQDRLQLAEYIQSCVTTAGIRKDRMMKSEGLWTWMAYIWFDQLCPTVDGKRKILETAKYICSSDYTDYYRHLVAGPYYIFSTMGEKCSKLFLSTNLFTHNDFMEQLASRQYIISSRSIIEAAHYLYWDEKRNKPKAGARGHRQGNLRRFINVIGQLELTYDIYSMTASELVSLLPAEFDIWKVTEN